MDHFVPSLHRLREMFVPDVALLELALRISIVYLFLLVILRVARREAGGAMSISSLLVIVLVADAVSNGMTDGYSSVTGALTVAAVLIFWAEAVDRLSYHFRSIEKLAKPRPRVLIRNGRLLAEAAAKEHLTLEEMMSQLRQQGIHSIDEVDIAYMEPNGQMTALKREGDQDDNRKQQQSPAIG